MGEKPSQRRVDETLRSLRDQIQQWRLGRKDNQENLASLCGVNPADLGHFLSGERPLPAHALANLALELEIDPARLFLFEAYAECVRRLREASVPKEVLGMPSDPSPRRVAMERAEQALSTLLRELPSNGPFHPSTPGTKTLADWPMAFRPLVVFVGDRRETPPKSIADLLAAPASIGDLYHLPKLQLPPETEIRSDKTVVIASPGSMRTLLQDKNLLIIGSPAANLMARVVNSGACFSFHANPEAMDEALEFQKMLEPIRYLPDRLGRYADLNSETPTEKDWSRRRRFMIYGFARGGILDPIDYQALRATATTMYLDYGVVSVCKHPWSEKHVAIVAAGIHGPATAAAIKLLSQENSFSERPLGGVFRVHVPSDAPWEERYHLLNPQWDTHPYDVKDYEVAVKEFADKHRTELVGELKFWKPEDVLRLLKSVSNPPEIRAKDQRA